MKKLQVEDEEESAGLRGEEDDEQYESGWLNRLQYAGMRLQWYEVLWAHVYSVPSKGYPVTRLGKVCNFGYGEGYWVQTGAAGGSRKGIHAFKDDKDLKKGQSIAPELLQALKPLDFPFGACAKWETHVSALKHGQDVLYLYLMMLILRWFANRVDVMTTFAEHEYRFRENKGKMEEGKRWREALTEVANLCGWDIFRPQYAQTEEIVQNITNELGPN